MAYSRKPARKTARSSGGYARKSSGTGRKRAPARRTASRGGFGGGTIRIVIEQPMAKSSPEDFIAGVGGTVAAKRKAAF